MKPLSFALVGRDISYSKSPEIFQTIFDLDRVQAEFTLRSVEPDRLGHFLREAVRLGLDGLAVTIPHKRSTIPLLDHIDPTAQIIGAVNCVAFRDKKLHGYNTDWLGFAHSVKDYRQEISAGSALIAGAGGAARAVIFALYREWGTQRFLVAGRSLENAAQLKRDFEAVLDDISIEAITTGDFRVMALPDRSLAVNCTRLGGWHFSEASPWPTEFDWAGIALYVDLNYNKDNHLVREVKRRGILALDGSAMLVAQAIESYAIWTGRTVPFRPVYETVFGGGNG